MVLKKEMKFQTKILTILENKKTTNHVQNHMQKMDVGDFDRDLSDGAKLRKSYMILYFNGYFFFFF